MSLPPPHPPTVRAAGAVLALCAAGSVPVVAWTVARVALIGVSPSNAWGWAGGVIPAVAVGLLGLAHLAITALTAGALIARPRESRALGLAVALLWLPLGCGAATALVLALLLAPPGDRGQPSARQARDSATSA